MASTNPIGCNPSGCSASRERKLEILEICKRYDILIIEGMHVSLLSSQTPLSTRNIPEHDLTYRRPILLPNHPPHTLLL